MVGWYEECYRLLCLAERLLADIPTRGADTGGYGLTPQPLPEAFRYEEVRTIATRLGHRYEQIENLLKRIDP